MKSLVYMNQLRSVSIIWTTKLYVLHLLCTITATKASINPPRNATIPAIFALGDSILDTGNNNHRKTIFKSNFPPYGRDFLGGKPTGRFCNGKIPSDLFAEALGVKELMPAYLDPNLQSNDLLTGVSFASAASGFDPLTLKTTNAIPLSDQLYMLKEYKEELNKIVGEERTNYIISNSLFLVSSGNVDIGSTYFLLRKYTYNANSYTSLLATWASSFLKELYELGARRIAVLSILPTGCLPALRTAGGGLHRRCVEHINEASNLFNGKLASEVASLNENLPEANMFYLDIYNPLLDIIRNHEAYGFAVADRCCCGTGTYETGKFCDFNLLTCIDDSAYVFWDSGHPTDKAYRIVVSQVIQRAELN